MNIIINRELTELYHPLDKYLYPYVLRYSIRNKIPLDHDSLPLPIELSQDFRDYLLVILNELLSECYTEPSLRQRTKNSSRYRKIEMAQKLYIVNYRNDLVGMIAFGIHSLINKITLL